MNYEELDKILNIAEEAFLSLANKHNIMRTSIERWRWDEPVITLTWVGEDQISRSIHALIEESPYGHKLQIEVNAWRDEDLQEGETRVRHWQHKQVGIVSPEKELVQRRVEEGYQIVSKWSETNLEKKTRLVSETTKP